MFTKRDFFSIFIIVALLVYISLNFIMLNKTDDALKQSNEDLKQKYDLLYMQTVSNECQITDTRLRLLNYERYLLESGNKKR